MYRMHAKSAGFINPNVLSEFLVEVNCCSIKNIYRITNTVCFDLDGSKLLIL